MRTVAIIQARMGSTRLPGKVLMDISGKPMLERVVNRTKRAMLVDNVVVATTGKAEDDTVVRWCTKHDIDFYRGSEHDVLDRYMNAATVYDADIIVRITSDCPFIENTVIDWIISAYKEGVDYASNTLERTFPNGLDAEAFSYSALLTAYSNAEEAYQRVHVTPYIYENPKKFALANVLSPIGDWSHHRWTVDTEEDLQFAREVYGRYGGYDIATWIDILSLLDDHPELRDINSHIVQKELHEG